MLGQIAELLEDQAILAEPRQWPSTLPPRSTSGKSAGLDRRTQPRAVAMQQYALKIGTMSH